MNSENHNTVPPASIDVSALAKLANLELTPEEAASFQQNLEQKILFARKLEELDLTDIEPMLQPTAVNAVWREDLPRAGLARDFVLKNAPQHDGEQVIVPKIL